ncbi:PREDICTED: protein STRICTOSIDINE SYNTHASE-LIKE 1-like [Tarenaya hassleriana]|uniref:protein STRICTOSIDINE SYNTHASE-LIKE 1-like n=1 Tax=Tarenaya hassleriana TaxID=28532 RepID=UPI00053C1A95|nr:PREDICTED: protein STRICTOSIDINE SYNTHASE-LIKE 1-like [Tarenaya hassleriana]
MRITAYWTIVLLRIVDNVALHLRFSVINLVEKELPKDIVAEMADGEILRMLEETPSVTSKREKLKSSIKLLKESKDAVAAIADQISGYEEENCSKHVPELEHICGRPLGLHFEKKSGDLYICDAYFGIMKVGPEGGLAEKVVDEAEGRKFTFTNHLDIDEEDDAIYFTDSSDTYQIRTVLQLFLSGEKTGRLIRYDKKTKEAKVLIDGLHFPNGVSLNKDGSFVIVCEPAALLVHRYWLKGPKAGTRDVFAKIPGYGDNIRRSPTGDYFWIALHSKACPFGRFALLHPWIGKFVINTFKLELMLYLFEGGLPHAAIVKLGENGDILEVLEDSKGRNMKFVSEALEKDGQLWIGSVFLPFVWVYDLN